MAEKKAQLKFGELEIEIMNVVWEKNEASVRDVFRTLTKKREIAYTTIMTTMQKLEKKGFLSHRVEQRKFIYKAELKKKKTKDNLLNNLVNSFFDGSHSEVVTSLVKNKKVSLDELKKMIKMLEDEKKT